MNSFRFYAVAAVAMSATVPPVAMADARPDAHAPIGVMGDHYHHKGEVMFSYRFMTMSMAGNRDGTDRVGTEEIATAAPNAFFGQPMQPPTLRVVPTDMTMDMHMFGLMYAPSDRVTLMLMTRYVEKEMTHVTFMGPAGTQTLGGFTTRTSGLGDTSVTALMRVKETETWRLHAVAGVSLPTASINRSGTVLAPNGMMPALRLPYPMQLGSGTVDPVLGLSYAGRRGPLGCGAQWRSLFRVADNDEHYSLGDEHRLTGWLSYTWSERASTSVRLEAYQRDNVAGGDPQIIAPVQTADPARQGARRISVALGTNVSLRTGHRIALEYTVPLQQDLDGPQLEFDWQLTVGYQYAF